MTGRKALLTMATGPYQQSWQRLCDSNWQQWANQHHYEIIVRDKSLDDSQRARLRPASWQKLLAMASEDLLQYDFCLWIDADILIHPHAPDPYAQIDPSTIAVTIETGSEYSQDSPLIREHAQTALAEVAKRQGLGWVGGYFEYWGFQSRGRPLFNNGVVGFNPRKHGNFLLDLYTMWEDGGPGSLAEMLPFNLGVQAIGWQLLDGRYNRLIFPYSCAWNQEPERTSLDLGQKECITNGDQLIQAIFGQSYFLHFAGMHNLMNRLAPELVKRLS